MKRVALLVCLVVCLVPAVNAQKRPTSALCTQKNAVDTTKQQLVDTRTFDNSVQRIAVLLRGADLLWPHEQETAMAAFMEAFDLAVQYFKELSDQIARMPKNRFNPLVSLSDQRFKVISALARRDPVTAQKLSEKILQDDAQNSADKSTDHQLKQRAAEKLLSVALGLAATDVTSALNFARQSLRYPATVALPTFFYELARTNRPAAELFYEEALAAYGAAPMDQFLFLSSYPFGNTREVGEMGALRFYQVPEGFVPNRGLQRQFMRTLFTRIEGAMGQPVAIHVNGRYSEHAHMCLALNRLEKQLHSELPDLFDTAMREKEKLFALLDLNAQRAVIGMSRSYNAPPKSFEQMIEIMAQSREVKFRDQALTMSILASRNESIEKLVAAIDKISDDKLRASLLNLAYHFGTQSLIAQKKLAEARKLVGNIAELDHRAYLFAQMAEESLMQSRDQTETRDLLNEVAGAVNKAPKTTVAARAVFAMAYLYSKIDTNRGIEELANAVKAINGLESPDFSQQFVQMKIQGPLGVHHTLFNTTSFEPETTFREMGKLDFDGSLTQATSLNDKSLRALTTLSVIEPCFARKSTKR